MPNYLLKKEDLKNHKSNNRNQYDILIIDDNFDQAHIIKLLMEQYGFSAEFTTDSKTAFNTILKFHPRLIILDLMMPDIDGLSLCKMIRENPKTADTKILIYSGKLFESDRRKAFMLGADHFLTKPTRSHILVDSIKNLLLPKQNEINQA